MDKRFLFRVWIPEEQKMYKGCHIWIDRDGNIDFVVVHDGETAKTYFFDGPEFHIMRCTGLTAAKSYRGDGEQERLIFADDICENIDGRFLVRWDGEKCAFVMSFYSYPNETLYMEEMWEDTAIIGNLQDHPELLGGEKGATE